MNNNRPQDKEKEDDKGSYSSVKFGPSGVEVTGPLGFVGSLFIGLMVGVGLTLYLLIQLQQPFFLIGPMISSAISATLTAQPTASPTSTATPVPTPTPPLSLKLFDALTGQPILPERDEFIFNPGQRVQIRIEPKHENKMYSWTPSHPAYFEPTKPTGPEVILIVPEKQNQRTLIIACELDEYFNCIQGREDSILIRTEAQER